MEQESYWDRGDLKHRMVPGGVLLDEVQSIEERRANVPGTIAAALGGGLLFLGLIGSAQIAAQGGIM